MRTNLIDVELTRVAEAIYVVRNRKLWRDAGAFQALHSGLPERRANTVRTARLVSWAYIFSTDRKILRGVLTVTLLHDGTLSSVRAFESVLSKRKAPVD